MTSKQWIKKRIKSFSYAFNGLAFVLKTQHNAWLHVAIAIAVICTAAIAQITAGDWRWIIAAITLVWFAEAFNTAFEFICDVVSPQHHESVQKAKDIAAGAVLISAIGAAILGVMVFWPYVF